MPITSFCLLPLLIWKEKKTHSTNSCVNFYDSLFPPLKHFRPYILPSRDSSFLLASHTNMKWIGPDYWFFFFSGFQTLSILPLSCRTSLLCLMGQIVLWVLSLSSLTSMRPSLLAQSYVFKLYFIFSRFIASIKLCLFLLWVRWDQLHTKCHTSTRLTQFVYPAWFDFVWAAQKVSIAKILAPVYLVAGYVTRNWVLRVKVSSPVIICIFVFKLMSLLVWKTWGFFNGYINC